MVPQQCTMDVYTKLQMLRDTKVILLQEHLKTSRQPHTLCEVSNRTSHNRSAFSHVAVRIPRGSYVLRVWFKHNVLQRI